MAVRGALTGPPISRGGERGSEKQSESAAKVYEDRCAFISALAAVNAARLKEAAAAPAEGWAHGGEWLWLDRAGGAGDTTG